MRHSLILIDGHAVAYRAYFALLNTGFSTRAGDPTEAVYGFTRLLIEVLEMKPEYLAVSFDRGLSGREELYGEYKGTRDKMPEDLDRQMSSIDAMVRAFNIPVLAVENYEADDVIGTAARQAEAENCEVRIITGDRDLLQLISEHTRVQLPDRSGGGNKPDVLWDMAMFKDKYSGLDPIKLIDLKSLMGDSSDNIPGVKGIGDKGAQNLILQFGSLEELYEHLELVKPKQREYLETGREMAFLSKDLATIRRNVPITLDLPSCLARDFDAAQVITLFDALEFGDTLRKRLAKLVAEHDKEASEQIFTEAESFAPPHTIVRTQEQLDEMVRALESASMIAFDTETSSLENMSADIVGISLAVDENFGYYIPVGHGATSAQPSLFEVQEKPEQLSIETVIEAIRPAMTSPDIGKAAHNASFDMVILQRYGLDVAPVVEDTMIAEWVCDPASRDLGLKPLSRIRLGIKMQEITELIGSGAKQITMAQVPIEKAAPYAAADAVITLRLVPEINADLSKADTPKALSLYRDIEIPLVPVLKRMEMAGVLIDKDYLGELSKEMNQTQRELEEQIFTLAGERFNINSTQQLNNVLFEKMKIDTGGLKKTKSGGFSLTAAVLDELAERSEHPIMRLLLDYRSRQKLLGTYVDALPSLINPYTGRVHTSFNQAGSVTGRLSSSNPNLQNIPIRSEEGRRVRRGFISSPGYKLLSVDYSQIELRILAHYSGDETLRSAFLNNEDIHRVTAARLNNIPLEEVTSDQRRMAKTINFGLMYGMGAFRLARDTNLAGLSEAEAFIKAYFDNFPGVRDFLENTKQFARDYGYVETLFGRRRRFPELQREDTNRQNAQRAEREAINSPIQGTNADIIKKAMIEVDADLLERYPRARMVLQVHDELVFEVPDEEVEAVRKMVVDTMEAAGSVLNIPVVADSRYGTNWIEMG